MSNTQQTDTGRQKIRMDDPADVTVWLAKWGCTKEQLIDAVRAVGPAVQDVREFIARKAKEMLGKT